MKKIFFFVFAVIGVLALVVNAEAANRNTPYSISGPKKLGPQVPPIDMKKIRRLGPRDLVINACSPEGKVDCDNQNKRFRKCKDGFWSDWRGPASSELEILERCTEECHPGIYYCNYRDRAYHYCQENGTWWPGGGGWETLPPDSDPQGAEIRRQCEETDRIETSMQSGDSQCWPGSYRCFNDGGYNRCGDGGFWSEAGNTSPDFASYLNYCVYPSRR